MSDNKSAIIKGEDSETDSEDENAKIRGMKTSIKGAVIAGEDSESEDENASVSSAVSALTEVKISTKEAESEIDPKYDSLLHRKLRECNSDLYTGVDAYCQSIVGEAQRSLNATDQQLLHSQLTIQAALTSLKSLTGSSYSLKSKLQSLLSAKFIPNINVPPTNK